MRICQSWGRNKFKIVPNSLSIITIIKPLFRLKYVFFNFCSGFATRAHNHLLHRHQAGWNTNLLITYMYKISLSRIFSYWEHIKIVFLKWKSSQLKIRRVRPLLTQAWKGVSTTQGWVEHFQQWFVVHWKNYLSNSVIGILSKNTLCVPFVTLQSSLFGINPKPNKGVIQNLTNLPAKYEGFSSCRDCSEFFQVQTSAFLQRGGFNEFLILMIIICIYLSNCYNIFDPV